MAQADIRISGDGRDEAGQQVAPGLYICQVEVESGGQRQVQMRPIAVAY